MGELRSSYPTELVPNCLISSWFALEAPGPRTHKRAFRPRGEGHQSMALKPRHCESPIRAIHNEDHRTQNVAAKKPIYSFVMKILSQDFHSRKL